MLSLSSSEKVLLVMRRHWFVLIGPIAVFVFLLIAPPLALVALPAYYPKLADPVLEVPANFLLAVYIAALLTYMLVAWLSYYLDVWIVTGERIIDVEQHGLFHREVSEIAMDRVQNVTVEIPGFIATALGFGTIRIQTAGLGEFVITEVPHCDRAKEIILKLIRHQ